MNRARLFFDELNDQYLQLLRAEGELYWSTHTGQSVAHSELGAASMNRRMFAGDASRLEQVREHLSRLLVTDPSPERDALIGGLRGWVKVLEANAIGTARAASILSELLDMDADLFARRQAYRMKHIGPEGLLEEGSPAALRGNLVH